MSHEISQEPLKVESEAIPEAENKEVDENDLDLKIKEALAEVQDPAVRKVLGLLQVKLLDMVGGIAGSIQKYGTDTAGVLMPLASDMEQLKLTVAGLQNMSNMMAMMALSGCCGGDVHEETEERGDGDECQTGYEAPDGSAKVEEVADDPCNP